MGQWHARQLHMATRGCAGTLQVCTQVPHIPTAPPWPLRSLQLHDGGRGARAHAAHRRAVWPRQGHCPVQVGCWTLLGSGGVLCDLVKDIARFMWVRRCACKQRVHAAHSPCSSAALKGFLPAVSLPPLLKLLLLARWRSPCSPTAVCCHPTALPCLPSNWWPSPLTCPSPPCFPQARPQAAHLLAPQRCWRAYAVLSTKPAAPSTTASQQARPQAAHLLGHPGCREVQRVL